MRPFDYHSGQRDVQREANSVACADKLATWVGPVSSYAVEADLIVLASIRGDELDVAALSGPPPLVQSATHDGSIAITAPLALAERLDVRAPWGGIVINPATARRSRVSGQPVRTDTGIELPCSVAFTNCRKYMTPTSSTGDGTHVGTSSRDALAFDDPWIATTCAAGETAFLVTCTPAGVADVSHRGGPPGFLRFDAESPSLAWTEYLGDGMFVSTGNVRADARFAMVVLDFESGDALRLDGAAQYRNVRVDRRERVDALLQAGEPFPVQGRMDAVLQSAWRLRGFTHPRVRVERRARITSIDTTAVQHPQ
jgi:hypothetical protein